MNSTPRVSAGMLEPCSNGPSTALQARNLQARSLEASSRPLARLLHRGCDGDSDSCIWLGKHSAVMQVDKIRSSPFSFFPMSSTSCGGVSVDEEKPPKDPGHTWEYPAGRLESEMSAWPSARMEWKPRARIREDDAAFQRRTWRGRQHHGKADRLGTFLPIAAPKSKPLLFQKIQVSSNIF